MTEKVIGHKFLGLISIIGRRFWDISKINVISLVFYLPSILIMFFILTIAFPTDILGLSNLIMYTVKDAALLDLLIKMALGLTLVTVPIIVFGPAVAGAANAFKQIISNKACQVWSIVWATIRKFFVKSAIISVISTIVIFVTLLSLGLWLRLPSIDLSSYEFMNFLIGNKFMYSIIIFVMLLFILIFIMMHFYIYQLLVQYDLPLKKLYQYSYTFALLRFLPNLIVLISCIIVTLLPFWLHYLFGGGMIFLFTIGLTGLIINYYTWPAIEKHFEPLVNRK